MTMEGILDFERIFHAVSAPCAIIDREFRFVVVNTAYLSILGATRASLLGNRVLDVFPEIEIRQQMLKVAFDKAMSGEETSIKEILYAIPDKSTVEGTRDVWWNAHFTPLRDAEGIASHVLLRVNDITELVRNREMKDTIAGEVQHRIGNLMAMVSAIARQTARLQISLDEFLPAFEVRINALARTHSLLSDGNWDGMRIDQLIHQQLDAYAHRLGNAIFIEGPELRIASAEAQAISMALHELTTNAVKYGALRQDGGRLSIRWNKLTRGFEFEWCETGLVDVKEPTKLGFGTMILTHILPSQLNGAAFREFRPDSFTYRLRVEHQVSH